MPAQPRSFRSEWVLPVVSPPIHRGEVVVDAFGRIIGVAAEGDLELPAGTEIHQLGNAILLPGLVNVHAHPELAMFRGALEDLPFCDWILRLVAARRAVLNDADNLAAAHWTMVESIRAGITTIAATEASGAAATAMGEAGVRGVVYQEVFGPDPRQADESLRQLYADLERIIPLASERVRIGVSPHAPYTVSDRLYREVARMAREERLPIAVHIAESCAERELVVAGAGGFAYSLQARGIDTPRRARSPLELLARLGVLDERPLLIHCVDVDDRDIEVIAASGCAVAHCPIANAKLGHGIAPILRLRAAGVPVGIGTDSVGSNNRLDLLEEARFASLLQRAAARRPDVLTAPELLELCTIDGARAIGLEDRIGTLESGKEADLCAVAIDAPAAVPTFDPVATLFHGTRGADVVLTVVAGEILFGGGAFHSVDESGARRAIEAVAERLRGAI